MTDDNRNTVVMSDKLQEKLDEAVKVTGLNKSEIIRRGIYEQTNQILKEETNDD